MSGLSRAKRRVRDPVGSRVFRCWSVHSWRGKGYLFRIDGGGGYVLIFLEAVQGISLGTGNIDDQRGSYGYV